MRCCCLYDWHPLYYRHHCVVQLHRTAAAAQAYLEALRSGPPPGSAAEADAQRQAEGAMRAEANVLLTQAGVMFTKVGAEGRWRGAEGGGGSRNWVS